MSRYRGDTIVEVLFATAIGGMIVMIALTLMSHNLANIQQSVEYTLVRQKIDGQAELLRYLTDSYKANRTQQPSPLFKKILDEKRLDVGTATPYGQCAPASANQAKAFYLKPVVADASNPSGMIMENYVNQEPETYAQPGYGMWIEAVGPVPEDNKANYIDFHLRACWPSVAVKVNSTAGTIVRLFYVTGDNKVVYNGSPAVLSESTLQGGSVACTGNCIPITTGADAGAIYSAWLPFILKYSPTGLQNGKYYMTINYKNNGIPAQTPPAPYKYKVNLTGSGLPHTIPLELDPAQSSYKVDLGQLQDTSSFTLSWTNDAGKLIDPALGWTSSNIEWDANLQINSVKWEKYE